MCARHMAPVGAELDVPPDLFSIVSHILPLQAYMPCLVCTTHLQSGIQAAVGCVAGAVAVVVIAGVGGRVTQVGGQQQLGVKGAATGGDDHRHVTRRCVGVHHIRRIILRDAAQQEEVDAAAAAAEGRWGTAWHGLYLAIHQADQLRA